MIEAFLWRENTSRGLLLISFRRGPGSVQLMITRPSIQLTHTYI